MFLKRLELQGFKSFARRVTLEFNGGVTAIVGPNGCGKSNLADALRWVLGEQSSRLLRARKVEEVIFGGSSQRSPLGMAEVVITLDNSQGQLPVDYSEVAIARRAYRSGESEYYINGQQVRLRQVVELLRGTKIGPNTYTIMGQGLVDAVLSLPSEERRAIIEEAADISRHRLKLVEAQEKLTAGQRDLERIRDVLSELNPQLHHLERQAERAQEQAQLTEELTQWQGAWYRHRRWEAETALAAARERRAQRQAAHQELKGQLRGVEEQLKELGKRRRLAEERLTERRKREEELRRQEQQFAQVVAVDSERLSLYSRQQEELLAEEMQLEAQRQQVAAEMGRLQGRGQELDQQVQEHSALLAAKTQQTQDAAERHRVAQGRMGELRRQALAEANRLAQLQSRAENQAERLGELEKDATATQQRLGHLKGELEQLAPRVKGLTQEEASLAAQLEAVNKERQQQEARQQQARVDWQALGDRLRVAEQQEESLRARLEILGQVRQSGIGLEAGVRSILQARQSSADPNTDLVAEGTSLHGVVGTVASLIQVPSGLERAIEAALEGYLQAVVVERWSDAVAAIDWLKRNGAGRANFIVMEALRPARPVQLLAERGVMGVASKLIRCAPRYQGLVDFLLGRTIITDDLAGAQRILSRGMGQAVTRSGELLRPGGIVNGGSSSAGVELLGWERELVELRPQLENLSQQAEALRAQQAGAEQELKATAEALEYLEAQQRTIRAQLEERQSQLIGRRGEEERLRLELGWLQERLTRLEEERLTAQERLKELTEGQEKALSADAAQVQSLAALEEEERQLGEVAWLAQAQVEEARAEFRLREGEREQSRALWTNQETALGALQAQIRHRRARAKQAEEEKARLAASLATARREHSQVRARLEEITGGVAPLAEDTSSLATEESRLHEESRRLSVGLATAEGLLAQGQAEEQHAAEEWDRLAAEIEAEGVALTAEAEQPRTETELSLEEARRLAVAVQARLRDTQARLRRLGPINQEAIADYNQAKERHDFLSGQLKDLQGGRANLEQAITELKDQMASQFKTAFEQINQEFGRYCNIFFGGGSARLVLTQPDDIFDSGIEILVQPPGKRLLSLAQLSGGERSLTATALLFALLEASPTPFCLLDEVDAALDDSNVTRFAEALRQLSGRTQFIVITHNRGTMETADTIYGISMGADNVSQVLSLRWGEAALVS